MALNFDRSASAHALTSRLYETEGDFLQMRAMLMEARARTSDWRYAHVGELQFIFFMVVCHLNPQAFIRLWHIDDKLVGYAILGEDPSFDFQVLPGYEWSGIEMEALAWAETRVADLRERYPNELIGPMVSGSRQDDDKRIAFLEQNGFRYCGDFPEVNMLLTLDGPIPDPVLQDGFQVREVTEAEISNRAAAQRKVWQPWTVGNIGYDDYARFMQMPGYCRDLDVVTVTPDGIIAAYVNGWIDTVNRIGDFGPVGALPAYRRQGLTRAALLESLRRMQAHGMERVCISTGETNMAARNLYESIGFRVQNRYLDYIKKE